MNDKPGSKISRSSGKNSSPMSGIIREAIFGINDGLVATVGLVSGEALSGQPIRSILIAGLSAVGAAMVSMAVGSFLATQSENDFIRKQIRDQQREIDSHPEREKREVGDILAEIGVPSERVGEIQRTIVKSRHRWLKFMTREELGIHESKIEKPIKNALVMGVAVLVGSMPPILPYLVPLALPTARDWSWGLSFVAALALGAAKGRMTDSSIVRSSVSFGILASLSAVVGASIGLILGNIGA